jgi:hypothetical protein
VVAVESIFAVDVVMSMVDNHSDCDGDGVEKYISDWARDRDRARVTFVSTAFSFYPD